jgi:hypothetical protein
MNSIVKSIENYQDSINQSDIDVTPKKESIKKDIIFRLKRVKAYSVLLFVLLGGTALPFEIPLNLENSQVFADTSDKDPDNNPSVSSSVKLDPFNMVQKSDEDPVSPRKGTTETESGQAATSGSQVTVQSSSNAYGDFNGDGRADLAIGVPREDVDETLTGNNKLDAGAVSVLYGSSSGLSATLALPNQFWTQSTTDVNDVSEKFDDFGRAFG